MSNTFQYPQAPAIAVNLDIPKSNKKINQPKLIKVKRLATRKKYFVVY